MQCNDDRLHDRIADNYICQARRFCNVGITPYKTALTLAESDNFADNKLKNRVIYSLTHRLRMEEHKQCAQKTQ